MGGGEYGDNWYETNESERLYEKYIAPEYRRYDIFSYIVLSLELLLALIGIIANCTVCGVLLRKKRLLKNFSNFHLFNLALTDILFRIALAPVLITVENLEVKHGSNALCKLGAFGTYTTLAVTFMLLLGIAFDRYFHIVHPIKARYITWRYSRNVVIFSWLYAAVCSSPFLYSMKYTKTGWNATADKQEYELCLSSPGLPFQISSSVFLFFAFLIPLTLMAAAYGKILKVLWQRGRSKVINSHVAKAKFRAVKMMIVIVVTYFFSWGPSLIWYCLQAFERVSLEYTVDWKSNETTVEDKIKAERKYITLLVVRDVVDFFTFTSSVLNPLIFGYYDKTFREDVKKCCCYGNCSKCCVKCKKTESHKKTREASMSIFQDQSLYTQNVCIIEHRGNIERTKMNEGITTKL